MVIFEKMTREAFLKYHQQLLENYSKDLALSLDLDCEEALEKARKDINDIIPEGFETPNQFFCFIKLESSLSKIGIIWYMYQLENHISFIADILIFEKFRGKGYGTETLLYLEEEVRKVGLKAIALHVFRHNSKARKLYEKIGYSVYREESTGYTMLKRL